MSKVNYKAFIENYFMVKDREGQIVPFRFNQVQNDYYEILQAERPGLIGVRENVLKGRQQGFSSLIDAIFTTDFILSALGSISVIGSQIISHKIEEVKPLFKRVDLYLNSYLAKEKIERKDFLKTDNKVSYIEGHTGAELFVGTAGAKTLGRGGTLQNLHWSEIAFYSNTEILNAEELVVGAEQQVLDGIGKIFRESTGNNVGDHFNREYVRGKALDGPFKSRFFEWFKTKEYRTEVPTGYFESERFQEACHKYESNFLQLQEQHRLSPEQIYWYIQKLGSSNNWKKIRREYPFTDNEAFLSSGEMFFSADSLLWYKGNIRQPITEGVIHG